MCKKNLFLAHISVLLKMVSFLMGGGGSYIDLVYVYVLAFWCAFTQNLI